MPGIRPCGNTNGNEQTACRSCGAGFPICDLFIMRKPASRHARGRSVLHTSCRRLGRVLLHIILRLGIGSLIYILWRTPTLRVFRWFDTLGITWWITPSAVFCSVSGVCSRVGIIQLARGALDVCHGRLVSDGAVGK